MQKIFISLLLLIFLPSLAIAAEEHPIYEQQKEQELINTLFKMLYDVRSPLAPITPPKRGELSPFHGLQPFAKILHL